MEVNYNELSDHKSYGIVLHIELELTVTFATLPTLVEIEWNGIWISFSIDNQNKGLIIVY